MYKHLLDIRRNLENLGDCTALITSDLRSHSYAELSCRVAGLMHMLDGAGLGLGAPIAVALERDEDMVAAIIACWLHGHPYVPLDLSHPPARLLAIIEESGVRYTFAKPGSSVASVLESVGVAILDPRAAMGHTGPLPPVQWPEAVERSPLGPLRPGEPQPATLAYVLFTSGSTGQPKGVMVDHANVENILLSCTELFGVGTSDRVLAAAPLFFDIHVTEIWRPLSTGATVVLVSDEYGRDPLQMRDLIDATRPTFLSLTPTRWRMLLSTGWVPTWKVDVVTGGEALDRSLADELLQRAEVVWDGYGPTETTVWSTFARVGHGPLTLGEPVRNTALYLAPPGFRPGAPLPSSTELRAAGEPLELWIGGDGVTRGYLGQPDLTSDSFVHNPGLEPVACRGEVDPHGWIYRTGDLVELREDGRLRYAGRADHQVKINGHRIELGEIEAVLCMHADVHMAAVITRPRGDLTELAAFVERALPAAAGAETVDDWRSVWNESFAGGGEAPVSGDSNTGAIQGDASPTDAMQWARAWSDSYTSASHTDASLHQFWENIVAKALTDRPRRVLEIGCGQGELVERLLPEVEEYWAVDFSANAIKIVESRSHALAPALAGRLHTRVCAASEVATLASEGGFDLVLCNSVIQYFPNGEYFLAFLSDAFPLVRPGGRLLLGDLRDSALLEVFHHSVSRAHLDLDAETVTRALCATLDRRITREAELLVDKRLWPRVAERLGADLERIDVELEDGEIGNEFTSFRYDVTLYKSGRPGMVMRPDLPTLDGLTTPSLDELLILLESNRGFRVLGLVDERVHPDVLALSRFAEAAFDGTIGLPRAERARIRGTELASALSATRHVVSTRWRELLATLSARLGSRSLRVRRRALVGDLPHAFDFEVMLVEPGEPSFAAQQDDREEQQALRPYTLARNHDLYGFLRSPERAPLADGLPERLREHLARRLPSSMVPAAIVVLDRLPTSPNGKIDRRALAAPAPASFFAEPSEVIVPAAPSTTLEATLCDAYTTVLGVPCPGVHADFFALGGSSLLAARLVVLLHREHALEVRISLLRRCPTPASLAQALSVESRSHTVPIAVLRADAALPFERPIPWSGSRRTSGRVVVLTGATGFIGVHVLRALLEQDDVEVLCLVRGHSRTACQERLVAAAERWQLRLSDAEWRRVVAVSADLARDDLGLSNDDRARLCNGRVDAFVHNGAAVELVSEYEPLRATNVLATRRLLELAAAGGGPTRFVFVSSLEVLQPWLAATGGNQGCEPAREERIMVPPAYRAGYGASKWVAEQLVARASEELGLDSCSVRLGQIGAHSRTGLWPDDVFTGWLRGIAVLGAYPHDDISLSVVPVDSAARFLSTLATGRDVPARPIWHLNNPRALPLEELGEALAASGVDAQAVPYTEWVDRARERVLSGHPFPFAPFLELFAGGSPAAGDSYFQTNSIGSRRIECEAADALLRATSSPCPPVDAEMLRSCSCFEKAAGRGATRALRGAAASTAPAMAT